jgi:hypothetical protein
MSMHPVVICLLLFDVLAPVLIAIKCWRRAHRTWWAHVVLAPALVSFYGLAYLVTFYVLLGFSGRLEGIGFLLMPPLLSSVAVGSFYYVCACIKASGYRAS